MCTLTEEIQRGFKAGYFDDNEEKRMMTEVITERNLEDFFID